MDSITIDTYRGWDLCVCDPDWKAFGAYRREEGPGVRFIKGTWPSWVEARRELRQEIDRIYPPKPLFAEDSA